jgi:molecular chaperone GrpE
MTNDPKSPENAGHTDAPAPETPPAAEPAEPSAAKHHDDLIAEQRREIADLKDRVLRAHADLENLRKRTEREKDDTAKYAITRFARDVLNVGDNFQRALAAVPPGAAEADAALKALIDGVVLTEREFLNVLERHGVKRIEADAQPFNPHLHQAVMELPRPDVPSGTVVQVFQAGYTIEDRTLRPAMVVVSTGGPKADKSAEAGESNAMSATTDTAAKPDRGQTSDSTSHSGKTSDATPSDPDPAAGG